MAGQSIKLKLFVTQPQVFSNFLVTSRYFANLTTALFVLATLFFLAQRFFLYPKVFERTDYISPPLEIKYLSAGFSTQMSDSFWLRAIQDFDFCDQKKNQEECLGKSWLFNVINLTVDLDTKFLEAYYFGGIALTVLISDYIGASVIFDKGVEFFPKDWNLLYLAGYHVYFHEKDKLKASKLYLAAAENGAPEWVRLMAGRLAGEGGDLNQAKFILQQLKDLKMNPKWIEKLDKKINQIEYSK
jgi:hypothetical protein